MYLVQLIWKSLWNRRFTSALTISSIGLSVMLLMAIERVQVSARESFTQTISQTDLIVGAKGGSIQLLLYSVFHIGSATDNISYESYDYWRNRPEVAWTIPYSLGDSHRGYRVVGTNVSFYEHYRFRGDRKLELEMGKPALDVFDVVLGSEVADRLKYRIGERIILSHGVSDVSFQSHEDKPFTIVGILERTGTPIDRSLYVSLKGLEAIHIDWTDGAPPLADNSVSADEVLKRDLQIRQITAFLLGAKSRLSTLSLQRAINDYEEEALMAIIPGVALNEMWDGLSYAEGALKLVSFFVLIVALLGMVVTIYNSLNERRREMAILRALGSHPSTIFFVLVVESFLLCLLGCLLGFLMSRIAFLFAGSWFESEFSLTLSRVSNVFWFSPGEISILAVVLVVGLLLGALPALRAYRNTLKDGLTVRI